MQGTWTTQEIAGKPADVYEPPPGSRPRFGVLHLHGLSGQTLRDRQAFTRLYDQLQVACICPHGQRSWWADRICREFDAAKSAEAFVREDVLSAVRTRWKLGPRAIALQGISMGGQGALRLAFKHADLFPVVAAIAPALEYHQLYGQGSPLDEMYDSKEQCRQDTAIMHLHPSKYPPHIYFCCDPEDGAWYRGCDRLHEKLNALGVPHTADLTTRAGGHSWDHHEAMAEPVTRFLLAALEQESRRLL